MADWADEEAERITARYMREGWAHSDAEETIATALRAAYERGRETHAEERLNAYHEGCADTQALQRTPWVPVSERLPDDDDSGVTMVLVWDAKHSDLELFEVGGFRGADHERYTHWAPIDPPESE